jgi:cytidylate kinase
MKDLGLNIVIQESRQETVNRYLKKDLKKHGYKIYSFYLDIDLKTALRRNIEREKKTMLKKYFLEDKSKPDEKDIVINTNNNSIKQVINLILKEIGEKRRKHELAHKIRKTV